MSNLFQIVVHESSISYAANVSFYEDLSKFFTLTTHLSFAALKSF